LGKAFWCHLMSFELIKSNSLISMQPVSSQ
jgi:hypothetical protein